MNEDNIERELRLIKQLLILQLVKQDVSIPEIVKAAEMGNNTFYKFISKNLTKTKKGKNGA